MTLRDLMLASTAALALVGCYDSNSDSDAGISVTFDSGPGRDAGTMPPPPLLDAGPPPTPVDSGPEREPVDPRAPARPGAVGSACGSDVDCIEPAGARCETRIGGGGFSQEFPGGYCTADCTPGSGSRECGAGSDCFSVGFGGFGFSLCARACVTDEQCRADEGYTCQAPPFGGGTTQYCLPPRGGGGTDAGPPPSDGGAPSPDGGAAADASTSVSDGGVVAADAGSSAGG